MIDNNNLLCFNSFTKFTSLIHGFSTRAIGDLTPGIKKHEETLKKFATALHINRKDIVLMDQVHGNTVQWVTQENAGKTILQTDGLLTNEKNIFLGVRVADCIPLFLYDQKRGVVGAVHAGWRGVYKEIVTVALTEMLQSGSKASDILVGIGPCLRVCCFEFGSKDVQQFPEKFSFPTDYIVHREEKVFLDLPLLVKHQLYVLGIAKENIEDSNLCTSDHVNDFYSYRKEGASSGRFLGLIGKVS